MAITNDYCFSSLILNCIWIRVIFWNYALLMNSCNYHLVVHIDDVILVALFPFVKFIKICRLSVFSLVQFPGTLSYELFSIIITSLLKSKVKIDLVIKNCSVYHSFYDILPSFLGLFREHWSHITVHRILIVEANIH